MSNWIKLKDFLSWIFLNQFRTSSVFFHCISPDCSLTVLTMFARILLLILPVSGLQGLMSLQVGLFWKFALWSFRLTKQFVFWVANTLSSRLRFLTISFCLLVHKSISSFFAFLYSLWTLFFTSSRKLSYSIVYKLLVLSGAINICT